MSLRRVGFTTFATALLVGSVLLVLTPVLSLTLTFVGAAFLVALLGLLLAGVAQVRDSLGAE